jgi:nucleotide-binding universal stress UspA family protein
MYQKIMVPFDGSEMAECVLPHVEAIATGCQLPDVIFARVVEPVYMPTGGVYIVRDEDLQQMYLGHKAEAERYLQQLVSRLQYKGVNLRTEVIEGKATESLAEYAEKNDVDLIIIATHGRSGVSRWAWGSIADRILRSACVPVLMVRAPGCAPGI